MDHQALSDAIASLPSLLPYATAQELQTLEQDLATTSPGCFAQIASRERWTPARHLNYLDAAIVDSIAEAEAGQLEGLVVSMPPRSSHAANWPPCWPTYGARRPDRRTPA